MALYWPYELVDELPNEREGTPFVGWGLQPRTYTRRWLVVLKTQTVAAVIACTAPGIPLPYSPYVVGNVSSGFEYDTFALLQKLSAAPRYKDDWSQWVVTGEYSTQLPPGGAPQNFGRPGGQGNNQDTPELEPPVIQWDWETVYRAPACDFDGNPFLNAAGDPYTPAPQFEFDIPVLVMERNELYWDRQDAQYYARALNKDFFLGAPPETVMCMPVRATRRFHGLLPYWRCGYRLRFLPDFDDGSKIIVVKPGNKPGEDADQVSEAYKNPGRTWQPRILNAGMRQIQDILPAAALGGGAVVPITNTPVRIRDKSGSYVSAPVPLDKKGKLLEKDPTTGKLVPIFQQYRMHHLRDLKRLIERGVGGRA